VHAQALSTVVFILAPDVGALIAARIVSGLSAGLMTGTATATLTELVPAWAPDDSAVSLRAGPFQGKVASGCGLIRRVSCGQRPGRAA
jgi:MFS family permease